MIKINFRLRNVAAIAVCLAVTVMFASCANNSDDFSNSDVNFIKADNIEGFENVAHINAFVEETEWLKHIIGEASLKNNGFELSLPSVLKANWLVPVVNENMQGVSVSEPSAKWSFMRLEVVSADKSLYHILLLDDSHGQPDGIATKEVVYVYADRPVELSGNVTWIHEQPGYSSLWLPYETEISSTYENLILSSGWNIVCLERTFEHVSEDLRRVYYTYSNKNTSDCKWRIVIHDISDH